VPDTVPHTPDTVPHTPDTVPHTPDTVPHTPTHLKIKFPVFYKSGGWEDFIRAYFPMKTRIIFIDNMIYALFSKKLHSQRQKLKLRMQLKSMKF
jgi:hypothetical protein